MNPLNIIEKHYSPGSEVYRILVDHSQKVADKALEIARGLPLLNPDLDFIEKAAMLHDIGICLTRSKAIGCKGELPYICHGYLGRELLDKEGLDPAFGRVAERHTGAGISLANILNHDLPLPKRDMVPVSPEEKIICCADKFFSKSPKKRNRIFTVEDITDELGRIDPEHAHRFSRWAEEFRL